jgi:hypothetical protein
MADVFKRLTKPTLVIWDAYRSGRDATTVIENLPPKVPVGFLMSGFDNCWSSAVVISGPENDCLPQHAYTTSDGTTAQIGYRVGHSMFGRSLLLEVAYSQRNLSLPELPDSLNDGPYRGFRAEFRTKSAVMDKAGVRDFFPPSVSSSDFVRGYNRPDEALMIFAQLILPDRMGTLYDDRGEDTGLPDHRDQASDGAFVLIDSGYRPEGSEDRSPVSPAILEKGFLSKVNADSKSAIVLFAQELHRKMERDSQIPAVEGRSVHVPSQTIACEVIEKLRAKKPGLECHEEVLGDPDERQRANEAIGCVNDGQPVDTFSRLLLEGPAAMWTVGIDFEEDVMPVFPDVRKSVATFLEIPLGKEDCGTQEEDRQCP